MGRGERLVGRADVKAAMLAALDDTRNGAGQLLLISGEAGIGKSAVLEFVVDAAVGCRVARGFCQAGTGVPPYWPWIQLLRESGWPAADLGAAHRLLDIDSGETDVGGSHEAADVRFRLHDAIGRILAGLAADRPLVVVLDDLHWADEQSLAVLPFLARALAGQRVLIVGAYRTTEAPASLVELTTAGQHLPLAGLTLADGRAFVRSLPGAVPSDELTTQVWRRGAGNPFFVRELVRLVQAQGNGQLPGHLPAGVIEAVRRRMARLPTDSVRLLDWAAVAGRDIDLHLLWAAGAIDDETTALGLLAAARRAGIISAEDPPRFTHDLFRDAILDGQAPITTATINLAIGRALQRQSQPGQFARIATHLLAAGPAARPDAADYSIRAAREATKRLGHDDACALYRQALSLLDDDDPRHLALLLELALAHDRNGSPDRARECDRRAVDRARATDEETALAQAALGLQSLGQRAQASTAGTVELLREADDRLAAAGDRPGLHSRVVAALVRAERHGAAPGPTHTLVPIADRAVTLARTSGDASALATALLARHDALWRPGSATIRLPVVDEMLSAAGDAGDRELVALAHQLRATALLELGDPAGRDELLRFVDLAGQLGHRRGRWAAMTRRATYAQIAGRVDEAVALADEALDLGRSIGEPDALGCWGTLRASLVCFGGPAAGIGLGRDDPMWPIFPLLRAWPPAVSGDLAAAREALGDFSVLNITTWLGLEALTVASAVFAAVGSDDQRRWAYAELQPFAGSHVVVGGCASYQGAVDHHLGVLALSLGESVSGATHLNRAVAMHRRLGATGWERLSRAALDRLASVDSMPDNVFRLVDGQWELRFGGRAAHVHDAKGLHDLALLIAARGADVHVRDLIEPDAGSRPAATGSDPVLDDRAKVQYRRRLDDLAARLEHAEQGGDADRADRLADERAALIRELARATGLGGRDRRLGDDTERARKTVSARLRHSLERIDRVHPELAAHLRASIRMGTTCRYAPPTATRWRLG